MEAEGARLALATAIAEAYADLARLHADRDVAARAVAVRAEGETLTRDRYANGLDNLGAQRLAESRGGAARADLAAADEAIALTRNRLAALLGAGPDRGLAIARPPLPALPAAGLPPHLALDLVGRRPDIAAARALTVAADGRIRAARAAFYPNIDLTALIGVQSLGAVQPHRRRLLDRIGRPRDQPADLRTGAAHRRPRPRRGGPRRRRRRL
ncbi:MAG: hypothetical protein PGN09_13825 [Sphingomonas fennica]